MLNTTDSSRFTATDLRIALSEIFPNLTCCAVPALDQYDALEAYRAYDDGGLETIPVAHATYVDHQQRQSS